jgi:hypothetical protein
MPKIDYVGKRFHRATKDVIEQANAIIDEYAAEGYVLTLRQLYYQFVSRALIPNTDKSYDRLGRIANDARLAGLIDWEAITDRTRESRGNHHFESPADILHVAAKSYRIDTRSNQEVYLEVWVEKDSLLDVVGRECTIWDVPYFSCRGYTSQSAMWEAAQRMIEQEDRGRESIILYLGDHDPSGLDMTRDIQDRMSLFGSSAEVQRVALNMDQVRRYGPPPNPAKLTDTRADAYMNEFGMESWELDSLSPQVMAEVIKTAVDEHTDDYLIVPKINIQEADRRKLHDLAVNFGQA